MRVLVTGASSLIGLGVVERLVTRVHGDEVMGCDGDEVMKYLHRLNDNGSTIIMVTHSEEQAKQAKRIAPIALAIPISRPRTRADRNTARTLIAGPE